MSDHRGSGMSEHLTAPGGTAGRGVGRWVGGAAVLALAGAVTVAVLAGLGGTPPTDDGSGPAPTPAPAEPALDRSSWEATVSPDAEVLGVSAGGKHRAYLVVTMTPKKRHVVNDMLGGVPVTVTYCNLDGCVRGFTATGRTEPLDLAGGGYTAADGMLVRVGGHRYTQRTGRPVDHDAPPFPYTEVAVERTTWGAWRAAHPDTELSVGKPIDHSRPTD